MKFKTGEVVGGKPEYKEVAWSDHWPGCEKCRAVDLDKPTSFVGACAQGSVLLREEMVKRQAPVVRQKAIEVKEWARKAGTFKGCA